MTHIFVVVVVVVVLSRHSPVWCDRLLNKYNYHLHIEHTCSLSTTAVAHKEINSKINSRRSLMSLNI